MLLPWSGTVRESEGNAGGMADATWFALFRIIIGFFAWCMVGIGFLHTPLLRFCPCLSLSLSHCEQIVEMLVSRLALVDALPAPTAELRGQHRCENLVLFMWCRRVSRGFCFIGSWRSTAVVNVRISLYVPPMISLPRSNAFSEKVLVFFKRNT